MSVDRLAIAAKVELAKRELAAAEVALDQAIKDLNRGERARKEIIGPVMESAFARLVAARTVLLEVDAIVSEDG